MVTRGMVTRGMVTGGMVTRGMITRGAKPYDTLAVQLRQHVLCLAFKQRHRFSYVRSVGAGEEARDEKGLLMRHHAREKKSVPAPHFSHNFISYKFFSFTNISNILRYLYVITHLITETTS